MYPVLLTAEKLYGVDVWMARGWFKFQGKRPHRLSAHGRQFSSPLPTFPSRRHGRIAG